MGVTRTKLYIYNIQYSVLKSYFYIGIPKYYIFEMFCSLYLFFYQSVEYIYLHNISRQRHLAILLESEAKQERSQTELRWRDQITLERQDNITEIANVNLRLYFKQERFYRI